MNRPYVFINVAMTADGKIDTFERKGAAISSRRDKERVDGLRAAADAVLVGGRTLLDEDPALIVKSRELQAGRVSRGLPPNPMKAAIVSEATPNPEGDFLKAGPARIVIFTSARTSESELARLQAAGVETFVLGESHVDIARALEVLYDLGVRRLMVEGGATLNFELLRMGAVDEVTMYVAPMLFGGGSAPTLADGPGLARDAAIPLELVEAEKWEDGGVLLHYRLRRAG
jgi:2,5-diamino-6-(ribosylamino)-4(3H)-pyrimidinone 5'-phosphate reductase